MGSVFIFLTLIITPSSSEVNKLSLFSLLLILSFQFSCVKDDYPDPLETQAAIDALVDKIHQGFYEFEVKGGTIDDPLSLPTEGMDGIYGIRSTDLENLEGEDLSLFNCINNLNPSFLQRVRLRDSSNTFAVCRYATGLAYKADIEKLLERVNAERLEFIREYEGGEISLEILNQELSELKERFSIVYLNIKGSYSDIFRYCLETLIKDLQIILNTQQWHTLVSCNGI